MNPYSFSATSLEVAAQCLARYKAEFIDRGRDFQGTAAGVGTVCHGTLEDFLRAVFIRKDLTWDNEDAFKKLFDENFAKEFGSAQGTSEYEDAWDLCYRWYHREGAEAYFHSVKIVSLEAKLNHPVPVVIDGQKVTKPFNYIMDRVDRIGPKHYKVVDYKSNRVGLTEEQLRKKRQARYYALMIQIQHKDAEVIEVEFDFLRHRPVKVTFTRDDNVETWRELIRATQRIADQPENRLPETLNVNCGWCVRKADCKTLQSNIAVGGIMSKSVDDLTRTYASITMQAKAQRELVNQIEMMLLTHAIELDELEFETDFANVTVVAPTRRKVNNEWVASVLGQDVSEHASFSVTVVDKLLKKTSPLTDKQRELLKIGAFEHVMGDPTVKVEMKDAPEL